MAFAQTPVTVAYTVTPPRTVRQMFAPFENAAEPAMPPSKPFRRTLPAPHPAFSMRVISGSNSVCGMHAAV